MSGRRQPSQSGGCGSTINSARGANSRIRCSCGKYAVVRKVKNGPNMGMRFYGCPLWPDTQREMFKWVTTTSTDLEDLEMKIMEKDTEICE
uniref:GRF-type domain-containing protein n=1 Tax=Chenopodium quinoa TaxID=63459 RepID=A0A803MR80_CHEQI